MKHAGKTRPFRGSNGEIIPGSIARVKYLTLGGIDQWVMIRGISVDNPPLILLHGGPGLSETALFRQFCSPLEEVFTVVYWDQRGSGKSFSKDIPWSSMTVEQFITDLDELVDIVCRRLGKETVAIFGHSWGSVLGVLYAARFPHKVAAYAGSGQIGSWPDGEAASYDYALALARRLKHRKAIKELGDIGPPPYDARSLWTQRTWLQKLEGRLSLKALWQMGRMFLTSRESSLLDLPGLYRGFRFSLDAMWEEVSRINLLEAAPALEMPVFFLLGRQDHWVPPETSLAYYEALAAPSKEIVWFEESGHEPFWDEPEKFNRTMVDCVRPAAAQAVAPGTAGVA